MISTQIGEKLSMSIPLSTIGEPFTIDEIDKHPDAQRIWRTIQEVAFYHEDLTSDFIYTQAEMDRACSEAYDRGVEFAFADGYDKGYEEGFAEGSNTKTWQEGLEK